MKQKIIKTLGSTWGQRISILAVIMIVMAFAQPAFFTFGNFKSILLQIAIYGIMACGMIFVILVGGIDFSIGSMSALGCVIVAMHMSKHGIGAGGFIVSLLIALAAAVVLGIIHGVFDAQFGLPAFVVTLATQYLVYGIATEYTDGVYIHLTETSGIYYWLGNAKLFNIPVSIIIFLVLAAIVGFVLSKTTYGRRIYAVGGNKDAAVLVGINPKIIKISAYVICSITAVIGGVILSSQNLVANYITGQGYEGTVMMAIVVGGISLTGGHGDIGGVIFGALLVGILNNIIILLGISSDYAQFVQGVVIIIAVALNVYSSRKSMGIVSPKKRTLKSGK